MKHQKKHKCPLCGSFLQENRYFEIVGVWDEKVKVEREIKKKLQEAEQEKKKIIEQQKATLRKLEKEKRLAIRDGIERGKQKEKSRADRLSKLVQKQTADLENAQHKIKELEKHLKNGTTPQTAGHDFERALVQQLQKEFTTDKIEHHGKGGDILHRVFSKGKEIGSILYECKKTAKFSNAYVHQTKRAIFERNATYGVLVCFASKKDSQGFFVENDIIVVHPFGAVHIAQVLRSALIDMHSLKLNHKELETRAQNLMTFIKSDDFKNSVSNTIYRSRELVKLLVEEYKEHMKTWEKRFGHYNGIHINTNKLQVVTKSILSGIPINKNLIKNEVQQLPAPDFDRFRIKTGN
ncbi:MAG TPA: hypothetical protein VD996_09765 [Chitinophagaceae bacterium]|nr:hypothetical protein [Chitinophagaceae bacterium]